MSEPLTFAQGGPDRPFDAPWQAQVFALIVCLEEAGLFGWADWAVALGRGLAHVPQTPDPTETNAQYYTACLRALERLLIAQGHTSPSAIEALTEAWQAAALATPHGTPITLTRQERG